MSGGADQTLPSAETESQTLRALMKMRELLLRGEFKPGERIREIPLAGRLGVSRTPLRLVLDRLEREGLLEARPKVGFMARTFTVQDIFDTIELRGVLEGTAARLAAERLELDDELQPLRESIVKAEDLLRNAVSGPETIAAYIPVNADFHSHLLALAKSPVLRRQLAQVLAMPFASPNAFAMSEAQSEGWHDALVHSVAQHRAIVDSIANREGARAESVARDHSRMVCRSVTLAMLEKRFTDVPGGSLVQMPPPEHEPELRCPE